MSRSDGSRRRTWWGRLVTTALVVATVSVGLVTSAGADGQRYTEEPYEVGLFYGTFGESPNTFLLVGGTVEGFCEAGPEGGPGTATARVRERKDGSVRVKVTWVMASSKAGICRARSPPGLSTKEPPSKT